MQHTMRALFQRSVDGERVVAGVYFDVYTGECEPCSPVRLGEEHDWMTLPGACDCRCCVMQRDHDEAGCSIRQRFRSHADHIARDCVAAQSRAHCEKCHGRKSEDSHSFTDCNGKHENSVRQKGRFPRSKLQSLLYAARRPRENSLDAVIF